MFRSMLAAAFLLSAATGARAHTGVPFGFAPLGGRPDVQTLAPGQTGNYSFRVTDPQGGGGVAYVHAYLESRTVVMAQYTFASPNAACGVPDVELDTYGSLQLFFPVTLPAGGAVECHYTVQRSAASSDDLGFTFYGPCGSNECVVRRGSFTDQSLSVRAAPQAGDGSDALTFRLVMTNHGSRAGATREVTTECAEFGGGFFGPVPFVMENDFPGACPSGEWAEGCLNFTGQNFSSHSFVLGPAPAGGESSCLVRLRYPGGRIEPGSVDMYFPNDVVTLAGGASGFDREAGNDANVVVGFTPSSTTHSIPVPRTALALLGGAFLLMGAWLVRRR